jgi:hypothetical protein
MSKQIKSLISLIGVGLGSLIIFIGGMITIKFPSLYGTILGIFGWGVVYFSWTIK